MENKLNCQNEKHTFSFEIHLFTLFKKIPISPNIICWLINNQYPTKKDFVLVATGADVEFY